MRRLRFDLTGLPPSPAEVDAFVADHSPAAYETLVDRLLASPQFGERMAVYWLDVVRYADSGGYHSDNERTVWLYRDYVIRAFNGNKPFDRFTIEQLAGDLLPGAADEQRIASGYNRLLQTTEEGGAQPKEYTAKYAADRVRNTGVAWLGSTLGCAQCHDHKFDPFTQKDFYSFAAFFADVREVAVGRQEQTPRAHARTGRRELTASSTLSIAPLREDRSTRRRPGWPMHRGKLADLKRQRDELNQTIPTTLITVAVPPREVRILPRGNWQDDSGDVVLPGRPRDPSADWRRRTAARAGSTWPAGWSRATIRWLHGCWSTACGSSCSARGSSRRSTISARKAASRRTPSCSIGWRSSWSTAAGTSSTS